MRVHYFALCAALVMNSFVFTQQQFLILPEAELKFNDGIVLFQERNFETAFVKFNNIIATLPLNQRTTASYIMAGKALYSAKRFREASETLQQFIATFPDSKFLSDAHFLYGKSCLHDKNYLESLRAFLTLLEENNITYSKKAASFLEKIAVENITTTVLEKVAENSTWLKTKPLLLFCLLKHYATVGNIQKANILLDSLRKMETYSTLQSRIANFSFEKEKLHVVGVLLPLSGDSKEIADEVKRGVQFSLDEYKKNKGKKIRVELDIRDTKREKVTASLKVADMAANENCIAVIGPLFSDETFSAGESANEKRIPLVSPTAVADEISTIGKYVFQSSQTYETQGRAVAQFAIQKNKDSNFVILSSNTQFALTNVRGFSDELRRRGGKILAEEYFASGATDFQEQIKSLRQHAKGSTLDGIYIALNNASEMSIITAQLKYHYLNAQIYGNSEWNNIEFLQMNKRDANDVIFSSDFTDRGNHISTFEQKYKSKFNKIPARYFLYGYDAMSLVLHSIENAPSREAFDDYLLKMKPFEGLHTSFQFGNKQNNQFVHIFNFRDGEINKTGGIIVGE